MINLDIIGKKIVEKRRQKGMTQDELAAALYVTRQAVSKWEMGKSLPSVEVLQAMTTLFDVSIDYILDGSDLKDDDYATMFMQYPRESVIYRFLMSEHLNEHIKNVFYLLSTKERKQIIDRVLSGYLDLDTHALWPYLSIAERRYLLGNMLSKEMDNDIVLIYEMLTEEERQMINSDYLIKYTHISKKNRKGEK
ncbi:MAG: helix-turn-helix transcriptional regulator [Bacilli bacterium]|nr:helix-turn-helix transcriptional regulator [Bacilli bacterium]MBN2696216.1 helix-turn-helix transcriptional regulator [Bacilli bacterium]